MRNRPLRLEWLEPRLLMSGNVTVRVSGQSPLYDLKIRGDGLSNQIYVTYNEAQGTWTVGGIPGTGTKVNGGNQPVTVGGVTNSVWIDMRAGDDVVQLRAFQVPNELHVDLDAGNDLLEAGLEASGIPPNRVGGALWIEGDNGNDVVKLANVQVAGNVYVKLGSGNDTFRSWAAQVDAAIRIDGDAGEDTVTLADVRAENLYAWLGQGNDSFRADRVRVTRKLFLTAGRGNDRAWIYGCEAAEAELFGGPGYDVLWLGGNRFGRLRLHGWEGGV